MNGDIRYIAMQFSRLEAFLGAGLTDSGSIHPSRAFYADSGWIMFPLHGVSSICDVVDYSVSERVYNYAPKMPVNLNKDELSISHVVAGPRLKSMHSFLGGEEYLGEGYDCGNYFVRSIYEDSKDVSVYKVVNK
ncbi:hypothetical protein [Halomonas sp. H10-9-1]|uniref:hypothetical protein n=1 Tax=Halomonas sp. H10-9-1 TaxID=2950871 RepID=UPI0032DE9EF2